MTRLPPLAERLHDALPDAEQQMAWIDEIVAFGVRRPGTDAGDRVTGWCADRLAALGYEVELQPVTAPTSHPGPARLIAHLVHDPERRLVVDGMTIPFTTSTQSQTFRLVPDRVDSPSIAGTDLACGAARLEHVRLTELPLSLLQDSFLAHHDPSGEFADHVQVLPFGSALGKEIDAVVAAGAAGMVGVVDGPWTTSDYFVPYDGVVRPIPAMWIDRDQGAALDELLTEGAVDIELSTTVENRTATGHNVIATAPAPGRDGDWIVIGSHHDAPWASAVEDASGIAQVLAQARAWTAAAPEERPASLAFLLTAAHMSDGAGTREFIASWTHRDRIRFALHLEHIAAEAEVDGEGALRPTDRPEVRWWFASAPQGGMRDAIVDTLRGELVEHELVRSIVLPPDVFGPMPPTDGGFFHLAGIPMVNLLAAPMYLFDPADTPAMVHRPSLVPTARVALDLTLAAADGWPLADPPGERADHDDVHHDVHDETGDTGAAGVAEEAAR